MMTAQRQRLAGTLALLIFCGAVARANTGTDTTHTVRDQRLVQLTKTLEAQRQEHHIPGMAVAIVQGDEIIYSHGFGVADLASQRSVTPDTVFAIGSSTKAFTASLVGMLVDEGKMDWDDPVTTFLPYFALKIDTNDPKATVTIRDLLAHRTGFTRMGLLWASGNASREEVLKTAVRAAPWAPFREGWFYNNVTYTAAGVASAVAAESPWDTLLAKRLLEPLGMRHSNSSIVEAQKSPRLSRGYLWNEEIQEHETLPMRSLDAIAPAGAINSTVVDMAQWLRFQLGRGTHDGQVLLSEEQHRETWIQQVQAAPNVGYGLGWMLRDVSGHTVVEHGGNIDGFSAQVALFPEADLGFVLLANLTTTPLQGLSPNLIAAALLADEPEQASDAGPAVQLDDYTGAYEANFGPFSDARFTVSHQDGRLAVDVPGQTLYQLEPPNDEGKWYFTLTNEIAVSFDRDEQDQVIALKMYQSGLTFELPREGVVRPAEIELSTLQPYLGRYRFEAKSLEFEVKISNQRLAVDVPGEMVYELHPPDAEGRWAFRPVDQVAVSFVRDEDGAITSLKLLKDGNLRAELPRLAEPDHETLPTLKAILARRPTETADNGPMRISGRVRFVHAGVEGRLTYSSDGQGRFRSDTDLGHFGTIQESVADGQAWVDSNIQPFQHLAGKHLTQAKVTQSLAFPETWSTVFDDVTVTGTEMEGDRKAYVVRLRAGELPAVTAFLDAETGDPLRFDLLMQDPRLNITIPMTIHNQDYRDVKGTRVAFRTVSRNEFSGETVFEVESVETHVTFDADRFTPPGD